MWVYTSQFLLFFCEVGEKCLVLVGGEECSITKVLCKSFMKKEDSCMFLRTFRLRAFYDRKEDLEYDVFCNFPGYD